MEFGSANKTTMSERTSAGELKRQVAFTDSRFITTIAPKSPNRPPKANNDARQYPKCQITPTL
jgi:hypothetical protein